MRHRTSGSMYDISISLKISREVMQEMQLTNNRCWDESWRSCFEKCCISRKATMKNINPITTWAHNEGESPDKLDIVVTPNFCKSGATKPRVRKISCRLVMHSIEWWVQYGSARSRDPMSLRYSQSRLSIHHLVAWTLEALGYVASAKLVMTACNEKNCKTNHLPKEKLSLADSLLWFTTNLTTG